MSKFIFVTGGLVSNIGKGAAAGSLGRLLKNRGLKVTIQKFDPYLNVDPGTMSPYQHGEVFVTDDGAECDLDIGHYERFLDTNLSRKNNISAGRLYSSVINKERMGKYVGATVQVIPNVTNEVKDVINSLAQENYDINIIEIGGTVNDYETAVFLHAIREMQIEVGEHNFFHLHVTYLPKIIPTKEIKVESVQASCQKLNSMGLIPDAVICRTTKSTRLSESTKTRIARRCFLSGPEAVIQDFDTETIYEIPIMFEEQGLDEFVLKKLQIDAPKIDINSWKFMVNNFKEDYPEVRICIVGKYTRVADAYISIEEAIKHAAVFNQVKPKIELIDAEDVEEQGVDKLLRGAKAIIVPPGWGSRGVDGMLQAIQYARENKIPFLGIGLGMQLSLIEFARDVLNFKTANSTEMDPKTDMPIVDVMAEQKALAKSKGTMRLGAYNCVLDPNSKSAKLYGKELISERHRHKFEFNLKFHEKFENNGMLLAGMNPETKLIELIEIKNHPYFVATMFEPEKLSRPNRPHPLFLGLMNTAKSVR